MTHGHVHSHGNKRNQMSGRTPQAEAQKEVQALHSKLQASEASQAMGLGLGFVVGDVPAQAGLAMAARGLTHFTFSGHCESVKIDPSGVLGGGLRGGGGGIQKISVRLPNCVEKFGMASSRS